MSQSVSTTESGSPSAGVPPRSVSFLRLSALTILAIAGGVLTTLALDVWQANEHVGTLQAHTHVLSSGRAVKLGAVHVTTGQKVTPGQKLMTLVDDQLTARLAAKRRELVEAEANLKRAVAQADVDFEWRKRELKSEIFQTQLKAANLLQEQFRHQVEHLAWKDHLEHADSLASLTRNVSTRGDSLVFDPVAPDETRLRAILNADAASNAAESLKTQVSLCDTRLRELQALEAQIDEKLRASAGVEMAEAQKARITEELTTLEELEKGLEIVSPGYGTVGLFQKHPGDLLQGGELIVELLDEERRYLTAYLPSRAMAEIERGSRLNLVFPGDRERQGLVADIPPQTTRIDGSSMADDATVIVRIEPCGKEWPHLPIGSRIVVQLPH